MVFALKRPKYYLFQKIALLIRGEKRSKTSENNVLWSMLFPQKGLKFNLIQKLA